MLFIGANARVGSVVDVHIGPEVFPQQEDRNGRSLRAMLINMALFIPALFADCHPDHATPGYNNID